MGVNAEMIILEMRLCPFCGKKGKIQPADSVFSGKVFYPRCGTNGCIGDNGWICFPKEIQAIRAWNKRAK